jgi:hypothetical protein
MANEHHGLEGLISGEPIIVAGIEVASDAPLFLSLLGVHVLFGLVCVVTGCVAMLSAKRPGRHPQFGSWYYWSLAMVFLTMAVLSAVRWSENWHLFALGVLSFIAASVGRTARRWMWSDWARLHIVGMCLSYVLLLTAFYVDNGPNLPLWNKLPAIAFWTLPAAVGVPIIAWALVSHPLARGRTRPTAGHGGP